MRLTSPYAQPKRVIGIVGCIDRYDMICSLALIKMGRVLFSRMGSLSGNLSSSYSSLDILVHFKDGVSSSHYTPLDLWYGFHKLSKS
jgi:hypothetical protein